MRIITAMPTLRASLIGLFLAALGASHTASAQGVDALPAKIVIDVRKTENTISPLLYGQFIEFMYKGIKGGLHAELIRDRGFESPPNSLGLPRYWERYPDDRNDDYGLAFLWDAHEFYSPRRGSATNASNHALRLRLSEGVIPRHGIYQGRIPIRDGIDYRGYLWLKGSNFIGRIRVALEQDITEGDVHAEVTLDTVGNDWQRHSFTLHPAKSDPLARFAILFEGRGLLWIDQVSLIPGDAVDDTRAGCVPKDRSAAPRIHALAGRKRCAGLSLDVGRGSARSSRDVAEPLVEQRARAERLRHGQVHPVLPASWRRANDHRERRGPGRDGAGSGRVGRILQRFAQDHSRSAPRRQRSPQAARSAALGSRQRIWGNWVRGHSDAATYASNLVRYAAAMRAVDTNIQLIAVGDNDTNWNNTVLRLAGSQIDHLAIHHYYMENEMAGDPLNLMARPLHYERFYGEMRRWVRALVPQRRITLAINEWGLGLPVQRAHSIEVALYAARLMNVFERNSDFISMTAVSDLVNGWPGGSFRPAAMVSSSRRSISSINFTASTRALNASLSPCKARPSIPRVKARASLISMPWPA